MLGDSHLSIKAKEIIDTREDLYFSIASLWEIAIKFNIGKLQINRSIEDLFVELQYINVQVIPITFEDVKLYSALPLLTNHRDPFGNCSFWGGCC